MFEVEVDLNNVILKCEALEKKASEQASELAAAVKTAQDARGKSRSARQEIEQA